MASFSNDHDMWWWFYLVLQAIGTKKMPWATIVRRVCIRIKTLPLLEFLEDIREVSFNDLFSFDEHSFHVASFNSFINVVET